MVEHYGEDRGMLGSTVRHIVQDQRGFMWIGTREGLNRFDGYSFKTFQNDPRDPRSLSDNFVLTLFMDRSGVLWVGTYGGGLNRFDEKTHEFTRFQHDATQPRSLSDNGVWSIAEDEHGALWVGTYRGLNRMDRDSGTFELMVANPQDPQTLSDNRIWSLMADLQGHLWIGTSGGGLNRFHLESGELKHFRFEPENPNSLGGDRISSILKDSQNQLWIGTMGDGQEGSPNGLAILNLETNTVRRDPFFRSLKAGFGAHMVTHVMEDSRGGIWVSTWGAGLFYRRSPDSDWLSFLHHPQPESTLPDLNIWGTFLDRSGLIWVAGFKGLYKIQFSTFETFTMPEPSSSPSPYGLDQRKNGDYVLASRNTLYTTSDFQSFAPLAKTFPGLVFPTDWQIEVIHLDPRDRLWVGTMQGLWMFDFATQAVRHWAHDPSNLNSLSQNWVQEIESDAQGHLWVGTAIGLNHFHADSLAITRCGPLEKVGANNQKLNILKLLLDSSNRLWIGTQGAGLFYLDTTQESRVPLPLRPTNSPSLSHPWITDIVEDHLGDLWISTRQGLNRYQPASNRLESFGPEKEVPQHLITSLLLDNQGFLWAATAAGLTRISPMDLSTQFYPKPNLPNWVPGFKTFKDTTGSLFWLVEKGLLQFHPDNATPLSVTQPPLITDLYLMNQPVRIRNFVDGLYLAHAVDTFSTLTLQPFHKMFSLEFTVLDFSSGESNQFAYQLKGFQDDWVYTDSTRRLATFTNLDPGSYDLYLKAKTPAQKWSAPTKVLHLRVAPHWYQRNWVRLLAVGLAIGLLWLWHRSRIAKHLLLERIRIQIACDLHDEIGGQLSQIAVTSDNLTRHLSPTDQALERAKTIGQVARETLESFSDVIWAIDTQKDQGLHLISRMQSTATRLLRDQGIACKIVHSGFEKITLKPHIRRNLYLIAKEAMTNILRHSHATEVKIRCEYQRPWVHLSIRDNGIGLGNNSHEESRFRSMRYRAKTMAATLSIRDEQGLVVECRAPMSGKTGQV